MAIRLTREQIHMMLDEVLKAGGTVHGPTVNSIIDAYNIYCMPPKWESAEETARIVFNYRYNSLYHKVIIRKP